MVFLKLFHVFFLIIWIGTLLFITKTYSQVPRKALQHLYFYTDLPAMCLTIVLGLILFLWKGIGFHNGWIHMKLTFSFLLIATDIFTGRALFKENLKNGKTFLILHILALFFLLLILFSIYVLKVQN